MIGNYIYYVYIYIYYYIYIANSCSMLIFIDYLMTLQSSFCFATLHKLSSGRQSSNKPSFMSPGILGKESCVPRSSNYVKLRRAAHRRPPSPRLSVVGVLRVLSLRLISGGGGGGGPLFPQLAQRNLT